MGRRDESTALGGCCSCPRSFIARARTSPRINLCVHHSFMAHAHSDPPPRINLYVHHSFMAHACTHARPHTHTRPPRINLYVHHSFMAHVHTPTPRINLYAHHSLMACAHTHTHAPQNKPVCPSVHISNSENACGFRGFSKPTPGNQGLGEEYIPSGEKVSGRERELTATRS